MDVGTTRQVDPRTYLHALWRWKWIFLPIFIAIPVAVYLVVSREQKVYQSTAVLEVQPVAVDASQLSAGGAPSSDQVLSAAAALISTTAVADRAARRLPPPHVSGRSLISSVTATANTDTGFITVSAKANLPDRAAAIANAFASAVAVTRAQQAVSSLNNAIVAATAELNTLPPGSKTLRLELNQEIQQDRALRIAQGANAQVVQSAVPVASPVSPHVSSAVVLGAVGGLLLGLVAVGLAEIADRRLRRIEDLEALTQSPVIGVIPGSAFSAHKRTLAERESFHTLRAALTYFNVDQQRRSTVIASPGKGDGKTTIAVGLATAAARTGSDVVLIDGDLRHPQVADRMGLPGNAGLASGLAGNAALTDILTPYELAAGSAGRLRVIAGREVPPNPAQLLASHRMQELLEWLPSQVDMVVIDTSPALMVADAFPLLKAASGTLVVARLDRTYKVAIERLAWTIRHAGGTVLGTVATGAEARDPAGRYDYAYGVPAASATLPVGTGIPVAKGVAGTTRLGRLFRRNGHSPDAEAEPSQPGSAN